MTDIRTGGRALAASLALALAGAPAAAGEIVAGIGYDNVFEATGQGADEAVAGTLEARTAPLAEFWRIELRLGAAGEIDSDADVYFGAGPVATVPVVEGLRFEVSVMPGLFAVGDEEVPQDEGLSGLLRTQFGLSYAVTDRLRVGAMFEHKSNADIFEPNPGNETVFLTLNYRFGD